MQQPKFYAMASWLALFAGVGAYLIGLFRAEMQLNEKGYYLICLWLGLFAAISVQKAIRDKIEGIPTNSLYTYLCWFSVFGAFSLFGVGMVNASLAPSEKGFYVMAFILALFASSTVQKNIRDEEIADTPPRPPQMDLTDDID